MFVGPSHRPNLSGKISLDWDLVISCSGLVRPQVWMTHYLCSRSRCLALIMSISTCWVQRPDAKVQSNDNLIRSKLKASEGWFRAREITFWMGPVHWAFGPIRCELFKIQAQTTQAYSKLFGHFYNNYHQRAWNCNHQTAEKRYDDQQPNWISIIRWLILRIIPLE